MKKSILAFLMFSCVAHADEGRTLVCNYKFYGVDFARVSFYLFPDGSPAASASITQWGQTHKESLSPEPLAAGEQFHFWISKEKPDSALELIIYSPAKAEGNSVMNNPNAPAEKEMWGDCQ